MNLKVSEIAEMCGGRLVGSGENTVTSFYTDSRETTPGKMFVPIRGENTDAHRFIPQVFASGAAATFSEEPLDAPAGDVVYVENTRAALQKVAERYRERFNIPVIGITGSVGKTTTKELVALAVSAGLKTMKTAGNANSQIGLPMTVLRITPEDEAAIVEMGVSMPGEMARIAKVAKPNIAVMTNIGVSHIEFMKTRENIMKEKFGITDYLPNGSKVFVNGDDDLLSTLKSTPEKQIVRFGLGENCAVRAADVRHCGESLSCCILAGERSFPVTVPAYGTYMIYSVLAAAAVSLELGLSDAEIARGLARYETVGRRSRVVKTGYCTLVDDCYNANPTSDRAAIDSLASLSGRHVCILGDMLEMGGNAPELHRSVGEYAAAHGVDLVITQGELAKYIAEGAGTAGAHYPDRASLLAALPELLHEGDVVLVKASHGAHFEEISEAVKRLS